VSKGQHSITDWQVFAFLFALLWGLISRGGSMLYYAAVFLVIALIAALFGFGGIAAGAVGIAKILFFVFLAIAAVTFLLSFTRRT
jgi:uncharacterized membrane protein YtjA (UPF0391 family)